MASDSLTQLHPAPRTTIRGNVLAELDYPGTVVECAGHPNLANLATLLPPSCINNLARLNLLLPIGGRGAVRCAVGLLSSHRSPGAAPQVGQRTESTCFGLSSFFMALASVGNGRPRCSEDCERG